MQRHSIVLDTDIGSDVDDAMALALILGRRDLDLVGVTTVYGDTLLRARLAQRYGSLIGRRLRVHPGRSRPLSGRAVWWGGHEGSLHDDLTQESVEDQDAVGYLVETVASSPGEIGIVAIGPLTNIAASLEADPGFERNVKGLWMMGGSFGEPAVAEHNVRGDSRAAARVFASSIPTVVSGLDITSRISIRAEHLTAIAAAGPLGHALAADIRHWWAYTNESRNVPHDPIAVLTLAQPDLFRLSPGGRLSVGTAEDDDGRTHFRPDSAGTCRLVVDLDIDGVTEAIVSGIAAVRPAGPG